MAKSPKQLINLMTPKVTKDTLDDEVRKMFDTREEGLKYIYGNFPEGDERKNALERLDRAYPETRNLRDRWNNYINEGFEGVDTDYWNKEIADIESQLPFENEEEHKNWSNQGASWMGEPGWLDLTEKILGRIK